MFTQKKAFGGFGGGAKSGSSLPSSLSRPDIGGKIKETKTSVTEKKSTVLKGYVKAKPKDSCWC